MHLLRLFYYFIWDTVSENLMYNDSELGSSSNFWNFLYIEKKKPVNDRILHFVTKWLIVDLLSFLLLNYHRKKRSLHAIILRPSIIYKKVSFLDLLVILNVMWFFIWCLVLYLLRLSWIHYTAPKTDRRKNETYKRSSFSTYEWKWSLVGIRCDTVWRNIR